ncbi:MAG: acetylornithine deacetylase [Candidatus Krumholzibacteriia bacterium]|jgi:acetylornithine deacetylase
MDHLQSCTTILDDLVTFPSISSDSNLAIIDYLADRMTQAGAKVDIYRDETGKKANLYATIGPDRVGGILLAGHTDVVPVADQDWTSDPFTMARRDGRLYGRGTCDMKGFIAATVALAPYYATCAKNRPVHFSFTYDEETGCLGAAELIKQIEKRDDCPALAIIGEPTEMRMIEGHKGCFEYTTHFQGREGHGSLPHLGVNAVEYAVRYVARLLELRQDLKDRVPADSRYDPPFSTINVGGLNGGVAHNVVAGKATVDWEMRPVQAGDADHVKSALHGYCHETLLPQMQSIWPDASIETEIIGEVVGLVPMSVNAARDLVAELTGANGTDLVSFGTEAGLFQSLGMAALVCGPGSIEQAHKPDEYVELIQLKQCVEMLERLGDKL